MRSLPPDDAAIETLLSEPTPEAVAAVRRLDGDFMVLGIGGKMGTTAGLMLVRALAQAGRKAAVWGVSRFRQAGSAARLESLGIRPLACDLADPAAVAALPDCANVLYLAGQKFGTAAAPEETWIQNAVVPAFVARKFRAARLVVFSTGCVYPFTPVAGPGSLEADPVAFLGEYASTCVGRERVFTHYAKTLGERVLLFRLSYAVELRYGVLADIAVKVLRGEPVDVSTGHFNCIWQGDAVARAIQCLELAANPPRILNVTGPDKLAVRAVAEEFGRRFGRTPVFTGTEAATAWLADAGESLRFFGPPVVTPEHMIARIADYLESGGQLLGKPTHFEARDGRF